MSVLRYLFPKLRSRETTVLHREVRRIGLTRGDPVRSTSTPVRLSELREDPSPSDEEVPGDRRGRVTETQVVVPVYDRDVVEYNVCVTLLVWGPVRPGHWGLRFYLRVPDVGIGKRRTPGRSFSCPSRPASPR